MIPACLRMTQESHRKLAAKGMPQYGTRLACFCVSLACGYCVEASAQQLTASPGVFIQPARRVCRREARAFQRHFEGPLPCAWPRYARLPAASRELRPGRPLPGRPDREPALIGASAEAFRPAAKLRDAGSPLNGDRSGNQQHKKDRHQYRWYEPLTQIEFGDIRHNDRLFGQGGSATLSVTDNSPGRAVIPGI